MSFLLTDEQKQIHESAQRVMSEAFDPDAQRDLLAKPGNYDHKFWQTCRDMGWTALAIPERHEGLGLGLIELSLVAEATGRAIGGAPFLLSSYAAAQALLAFDEEDLKTSWLPKLAHGEKIGTVAFGSGGDAVVTAPSMRWSDGLLTGTARAVLAGTYADFVILLASDGAEPMLLLAELGGETHREVLNTYDNSRGVADLHFSAAPARPLVTQDAVEAAWSILERASVVLAAEQVGGADKCLELACQYAQTRQAFGQPIGKFQAIKHKLAEIYVANQIARANVMEAALRHDQGRDDFGQLAAAARISASEAYDLAARESIQVFGGIGATWESDMHLHLRRARSAAGALGSRFVWQDRLISKLERAA